jgi:hypothetical protein
VIAHALGLENGDTMLLSRFLEGVNPGARIIGRHVNSRNLLSPVQQSF